MHIADTGNGQWVRLHCCGGGCVGGESQFLNGRSNLRVISIANDKGACTEVMAIEIEVLFCGLHLCIYILESERRQHIVGCVLDDKDIACSLDDARYND